MKRNDLNVSGTGKEAIRFNREINKKGNEKMKLEYTSIKGADEICRRAEFRRQWALREYAEWQDTSLGGKHSDRTRADHQSQGVLHDSRCPDKEEVADCGQSARER